MGRNFRGVKISRMDYHKGLAGKTEQHMATLNI